MRAPRTLFYVGRKVRLSSRVLLSLTLRLGPLEGLHHRLSDDIMVGRLGTSVAEAPSRIGRLASHRGHGNPSLQGSL